MTQTNYMSYRTIRLSVFDAVRLEMEEEGKIQNQNISPCYKDTF